MDTFTDSEEEYTKQEKLLLTKARRSLRRRKDESDDEEVFGLGSDDDDEEEAEDDTGLFHGDDNDSDAANDIDMGSDLDGDDNEDRLPEDRAWGKNKRNYYSTDYVDQDYGGMYQGKEGEGAEMEEQEARTIQKRLMEQLKEADFAVAEMAEMAEPAQSDAREGPRIQGDLSRLSKRQKLDLLAKESPELLSLVGDLRGQVAEARDRLVPIALQAELSTKTQPSSLAMDLVTTKLQIVLNYCTNIAFYLLLKSQRAAIKDHPVVPALFRYRQLLQQLAPLQQALDPQLETLLQSARGCRAATDTELLENSDTMGKKRKNKKMLKVLLAEKSKKRKGMKGVVDAGRSCGGGQGNVDAMESGDVDTPVLGSQLEAPPSPAGAGGDPKRAITYEMAKNKGLIPKRSKEQRNPRVKHRNKYRKAKIRRRGQVRSARLEVPVYGGEPGGIKIGLTKSVKFQ